MHESQKKKKKKNNFTLLNGIHCIALKLCKANTIPQLVS